LGEFGPIWKKYTEQASGETYAVIAPGQSYRACMIPAYVKETAKLTDGATNYYDDLVVFGTVFGLPNDFQRDPANSVDSWVDDMSSTKSSSQGFKLKVGCVADTPTDTNPLDVKSCDPAQGDDQCLDANAGETSSTDATSCCNTWKAVEFAEGIKMGVFGQNWKTYAKVDTFEAG
jgi:hypothetical protein